MPNIKLFADLSNAAYDLKLLDTSLWTMRGEINIHKKNAYGFVVTHKVKNILAISIRGTIKSSFRNILTDMKAYFTDYPYCEKKQKCRVHRGFWRQFVYMKPILEQIIIPLWNAMKNFPNAKIIVTGHSLGGAVATIIAAYLRRLLNLPLGKLLLLAFGSPRVGNYAFVKQINKDIGVFNIFRVNYRKDPIIRTPGLVLGYVHVGNQRSIECETDQTCHIRVGKDHDTFIWNLLLRIKDHSGYFSLKRALSIK